MKKLRELERASRVLEPSASERKRIRGAIVASTEAFLRGVDELHAYVDTEDKGAGLLDAKIGEVGISLEQAIAMIEHDVVRPGGNPASGGHLAYIPGGGIYHSALADFMAAVTNKYPGIFFTGPGPVRMENLILRWASDLIGYPATAGGNLSSGGSIANLTAITTARDAHGLKGATYANAVVYLTSQAHHSIEKALHLAGVGEAPVRVIPIDDRFRMRADVLAQTITDDRANGLNPWLIVAAAGATDTGAVDPLDAIADIAAREQCWFHVDAAYGGFFMLTEEGRTILRGIERSDSVILDPHKSLFLPWGSGMVLVRDGARLAATHSYSGHYMQDADREPGEVSPSDVSPELSKPFRALRMWLPLVLLGTKPFAAALEEKMLLAQYFHRQIGKLGFDVGPWPDLSIVTFRHPGTNAINQQIVDAVRRDGRIFLSSTMLDDRFTLRMAALSFRTHRKTIDLALRILREVVSDIRSASAAGSASPASSPAAPAHA